MNNINITPCITLMSKLLQIQTRLWPCSSVNPNGGKCTITVARTIPKVIKLLTKVLILNNVGGMMGWINMSNWF